MVGHRPSDWHVLDLDKDPTPGDPQRVRTLAKTLHDFADDVSEALRLVKGMAGESTLAEWAGKSATVFKDEFSGVPKNLKKLEKSYGMCGDALADFWPKLERAQALADRALVKAREARQDLTSAQSKLSSADSWVTRASKEADKYKDDPTGSKSDADKPDEAKVRAATRDVQHARTAQTNAQSAVDSAQGALDAAKKMAADARKMRDDAAREAKDKIDEASDAGIQNRSWWEDVGDWFSDNWDNIVAVCKVVVAIVGIIAMVIGGPILGAIVLVAALVVLADTLYKYSKGQASLWDVGLAALDCIPGMKGLTTLGGLAKGLKGGMAAMKGIKGGLKGMATGVRGLGQSARGAIAGAAKGAYNRVKSVIKGCGDPVDIATGAMFLVQTDVELTGSLPFTVSRRASSQYCAGWWFGPSWASTLDQHLEVDDAGVVFATEDGQLLAYPAPTDTCVRHLPVAGPRWPLTLLDDGGYRIEDPVDGVFRDFGRPVKGLAPITRIHDRNANSIVFEYDAYGSPVSLRHTGGYHLRIATEAGRVTGLSMAGAADDGTDLALVRYGYTDGNLTEITDSSGTPLVLTYDARARITSWTDTNGSRYSYVYDSGGRCVAQGGEAGHLVGTFEYGSSDATWPDHSISTWTSADGSAAHYVINENSQVVAEIDPLGNVTRIAYDENHHLTAFVDALGNTTRYDNNEFGQPLVVTHPDASQTRYAYDGNQKITDLTLPDGNVWHRDYDARGNCISVCDPTGVVTRYDYDDRGHPVAVMGPASDVTRIRCDAAGIPVVLEDPLGNRYLRQHDAFGRPVEITDPLGNVTRLRWTPEGRLARRVFPDGGEESWTYDGEGNVLRHVDTEGNASAYAYTHFDLLASRTRPDGSHHEFHYDTALRLVKVTDSRGEQWQYRYDAAGRLTEEIDFDGARTMYTHDAAGRITQRVNSLGQSVSWERDRLGQALSKSADGVTTSFTYDLAGRVVRAENQAATLSMNYDSAGRLTSESTNGRTVHYEYDPSGRRISRTMPSGERSLWSYDSTGQQTQMVLSGRNVDLQYDAAGRRTGMHFDQWLSLSQEFDTRGRLLAQSATSGTGRIARRRTYTYQGDTPVSIHDQGVGTRHLGLDATGRVTTVEAHGWSESYVYDEAGNQSSAQWPSQHAGHDATGSRNYDGTRLKRAGRVRYEYDSQGRVILKQKVRLSRKPETWRYFWDAEDRLTSVLTPDGSSWRYTYDPIGRRIHKRCSDPDGAVVESTVFAWDGAVLGEQTTISSKQQNPVTLTWDHQGFRPVAQRERITAAEAPQDEIDSRFFAIITDLVGSPTDLIDETGETAWRSRSTLWGKTTWDASSSTYTPLRFPGQYFDPETELHYNYFRYYDPEVARYLTSDPLGLVPGPNAVTYVENPFVWIDPLGLSPCSPGTRDDALLALDRAEELQSLRNDYFMADLKGTTSVIGVFNSQTKQYVKRIGINGSGPMPSTWTLKPGEEFVQAPGHAEEGILGALGPNEHAVYGAASRNFCNDICLPKIDVRGIEIGGEGIRGHAPQNSAYTLFWSR
ncbi:RHS repeat-associated core domain-containing protein [Streptomyces sp. NPDC048306]|uniref:RHS repeat-associated core domain-containing protein n=1 Tax=Streptomyces sp. NPDC048306 TaxID=3154502 RepID=UPI0033D93CCB